MTFRSTFVVALPLLFAQATLHASISYTFGTTNDISFAGGSLGAWTETTDALAGDVNASNENIACVVGLSDVTDVCGATSPPSGAANVSLPAAPGGTPGTATNYFTDDADFRYGAPIWTQMTLTVGANYVISFYEASNEETRNTATPYTDTWQVFIIPGTTGDYICPTCTTPVNPVPSDKVYTSTPISNPGEVATNWTAQSFTFTATSANEVLEFVANAVGTTPYVPPMLDLAGVTSAQTPESGTWALTILGIGTAMAIRKLRGRSSAGNKRSARG